jgi:hypothetical protein
MPFISRLKEMAVGLSRRVVALPAAFAGCSGSLWIEAFAAAR